MGLYLVRQMTSAELLQRLKTIGIKHPKLYKALGEWLGKGLSAPAGEQPPPFTPLLSSTCVNPTFYLNRLAELCVSRGRSPQTRGSGGSAAAL